MSNINLVDPNKFTDTNNQTNLQRPAYEDMHIFADLTAYRRERSVIETKMDINKLVVPTHFGDSSKVYNLLGSNDNNEFTTNWSAEKSDNSNLEGFGIESIKVTVNTSFIPQVDIKFVDYRGRAFFNNDNSPYRMLFDFPPPIFKLTIKGYYGLGLTYLLHLVKYTTEFKSDNGFFYIDAKFVALTFAPLADIPFSYVIHFQYLEGESVNPNKKQSPKNTLELLLKIKDLYTNLPEKIKNLPEQLNNNILVSNIPNIDDAFNFLYNLNDVNNTDNLNAKIFKLNTTNIYTPVHQTINNIEIVSSVRSYNDDLKSRNYVTLQSNPYNKLCVGYKYSKIKGFDFLDADIKSKLNKFQKNLITVLNKAGVAVKKEIAVQDIVINGSTIENNGDYLYLDLTDAYSALKLKQTSDNNNIKSGNNYIISQINNIIYNDLGMLQIGRAHV